MMCQSLLKALLSCIKVIQNDRKICAILNGFLPYVCAVKMVKLRYFTTKSHLGTNWTNCSSRFLSRILCCTEVKTTKKFGLNSARAQVKRSVARARAQWLELRRVPLMVPPRNSGASGHHRGDTRTSLGLTYGEWAPKSQVCFLL